MRNRQVYYGSFEWNSCNEDRKNKIEKLFVCGDATLEFRNLHISDSEENFLLFNFRQRNC